MIWFNVCFRLKSLVVTRPSSSSFPFLFWNNFTRSKTGILNPAFWSSVILTWCRLVRELEKKFSDRHVLLVAQRKIMPKPTRRSRTKQARPRSRTLTAVHENLLEDLVFPTEIVGKRTRVKVDGTKLIKWYVFPLYYRFILLFAINNGVLLLLNLCIKVFDLL